MTSLVTANKNRIVKKYTTVRNVNILPIAKTKISAPKDTQSAAENLLLATVDFQMIVPISIKRKTSIKMKTILLKE